MACFNGDNYSYTPPSAPEELGLYPLGLRHESVVTTGSVHNHAAPTFTDDWLTIEQLKYMASSLTGLLTGMDMVSISPSSPLTFALRASPSAQPLHGCFILGPTAQLPLTRGQPAHPPGPPCYVKK